MTLSYTEKYPTLTVAIPTYNEATNIESLIKGFLSTNYPNLIELFVADGGSTDGTQDIVKRLELEDNRVKLIHNPLKIQSAGLNLILNQCSGEIFLRADAHSEYADDYIEKCVEILLFSQALNVGGAQRFVAKTNFQSAVAIATKSILGSGGAKYRNPEYDGYADTVYIGCFWKQALLDVGGFDTTQITNQDAELNQKLLRKNEKAIYISSKIRVWYYPRENWKSLWIQYFKYGRGRYMTTTKHYFKSQVRGNLPFITIATTVSLLLIDLLLPQVNLHIEILIVIGILLTFLESLRTNLKINDKFDMEIWRGDKNKIPSFLNRWFGCEVVLLTMSLSHACGYAYQLIRHRLLGVTGW
ncbi:glycosyl transferase, family 2 [Richelia sinica FACHB-800]|uniref:Glycosyl transferase, family 2 n=1 Tax=Richelia sinica FACHB-800 TaxID=1357546 RepID=A0A975TBF8_9NOST|nr:glycosyltransferase family 2 protein [Richelia sinica]MBD2664828.1 glycosyltransferase family 2 protein [Richelia sinica FACHB-800]QXE25385.1 glycosyl transferase, family 2 [Richelia sinica FACHB-800]